MLFCTALDSSSVCVILLNRRIFISYIMFYKVYSPEIVCLIFPPTKSGLHSNICLTESRVKAQRRQGVSAENKEPVWSKYL